MRRKRHALLIGIDSFKNPVFNRLIAPAHDVNGLEAILSDADLGGFNSIAHINIDSQKAQREIEAFFKHRDPYDNLLLYYSGHGIKDDNGRLYLTTTDTDTEHLRSTSVSARFIQEAMDDCRALIQILILDCCYSGAFSKDLIMKGEAKADIPENFLARGRTILTASNSIQIALDSDFETIEEPTPSIFTQWLINGLKSGDADLDQNGEITIEELYSYTFNQVRQETSLQTPQYWSQAVEGSFVICNNPHVGSRPSLFLGQWSGEVDDDGWLRIPSRFGGLENGAITLGFDQNIMLLRKSTFDFISERVLLEPVVEKEWNTKLRRIIFGNTIPLQKDIGNRVKLEPFLLKAARIEKDVVLVGVGDYIEIWSLALWNEQMGKLSNGESLAQNFDALNLYDKL